MVRFGSRAFSINWFFFSCDTESLLVGEKTIFQFVFALKGGKMNHCLLILVVLSLYGLYIKNKLLINTVFEIAFYSILSC